MASRYKKYFSKGSSIVKAETTKIKIGSDGLPEITSVANWIPKAANKCEKIL